MKRREIIRGLGLAGLGIMLPSMTPAGNTRKSPLDRVLRIAHITDVHLSADNNAPQKFINCIDEIKKHNIDFILNGGDSIMAADYDSIDCEMLIEMWDLWKNARATFFEYEMYSCLGNHDMWWAATDKNDHMYGKKFAMVQLKMPAQFYSFDKAEWHFIVLDSNNNGGGSLGEEQLQWLTEDLAALPQGQPVLIMSHYPILSACTHAVGGNHHDALKITKVFYRHRDKKIHCISGHIHLLDTAVYNDVNYYCNGAISGFWWGEGNDESAEKYWYHETPPGYVIIDLYADGTLDQKYYPQVY